MICLSAWSAYLRHLRENIFGVICGIAIPTGVLWSFGGKKKYYF
jgi:hypothetical protein